VTAVVKAESLTKRFGEVMAVTDLSFVLEAGTITGFLGPNGAGKTTTLRMVLGLASPMDAAAATARSASSGRAARTGFPERIRNRLQRLTVWSRLADARAAGRPAAAGYSRSGLRGSNPGPSASRQSYRYEARHEENQKTPH
jgi:ABC-type branched-subunit amino acid transport system ATPase component